MGPPLTKDQLSEVRVGREQKGCEGLSTGEHVGIGESGAPLSDVFDRVPSVSKRADDRAVHALVRDEPHVATGYTTSARIASAANASAAAMSSRARRG